MKMYTGLQPFLLRTALASAALACLAPAAHAQTLAATPPMGWNDWAHYQCNFTAQTILDNAKKLQQSGLARLGYNTVTIDDCWMQKARSADGNLQVDPVRFPHGMKPVADQVHALGLKFGIYEDAGYATCGGYAGSGEQKGGGPDHFLQDAKLFASWGVDYLKLDGCNLYVPQKGQENEVYHKAYTAEHKAIQAVSRPIAFSESAPAYFQGQPNWYDVLAWVKPLGQLWREGDDIEIYRPKDPTRQRWQSMTWNYAYNQPLGRFQAPGNWNDADFIIAGDSGLTLPESRTQMALWSMMSAPLILSSDLPKLSPQAMAVISNQRLIAVDQDAKGAEATLVYRDPQQDVLLKPLTASGGSSGGYAVAVLNHGASPLAVSIAPAQLGFPAACSWKATDLWTGADAGTGALAARVASHDTAIWRVVPDAHCGPAPRMGVITRITQGDHRTLDNYTLCLSAEGSAAACNGAPSQRWTVRAGGTLAIGNKCLTAPSGSTGNAQMQPCSGSNPQQHWHYTLAGNLQAAGGQCLSSSDTAQTTGSTPLSLEACGHNTFGQVWSLPN